MSNYKGGVKNRRKRALDRLKAQLVSKTKTEKVAMLTLATTGANQIPLEEKDIARIKKEIGVLESKS